MKDVGARCAECGASAEAARGSGDGSGEHCSACGAPLDGSALSAFADRLARFGLGNTSHPLLSNPPELPNG